MPKIIERAKLELIRQEDGAQCYRYGNGNTDVVWLCGHNRADNVSLGVTGKLVYSAGPCDGLWSFYPYAVQPGSTDEDK